VRLPDFEEEENDGQKMGEVTGKSDDIHGVARSSTTTNISGESKSRKAKVHPHVHKVFRIPRQQQTPL